MNDDNTGLTWYEILGMLIVVGFVVILALSAIHTDKMQRQPPPKPAVQFNIGDVVYIDGIFVTGIVSHVTYYDVAYIDVMIRGSNNIPYTVKCVNSKLIKELRPKVIENETINDK